MKCDYVTQHVAIYREVWKSAFAESERRAHFEEVATLGVSAYEVILRTDENWRRAIYRGERAYDEKEEAGLISALHEWAVVTRAILEEIAGVEQGGVEIVGADLLRVSLQNGILMLTPDDEFFDDDLLVELRDQALDEHARGETFEHGAG